MPPTPESADRIQVEVCVDSVQYAIAAESAGADRIELNSALELDGLTPSAGLVHRVRQSVALPVIAMARPRSGNFCYSDDEWATLLADVDWMLAQGVEGIAFGCLDSDGRVQAARCREIRERSRGKVLVFHKAFDAVANWRDGLETLVACGIDRIMTSGQATTAVVGIPVLTQMQELAGGRIDILPAGGVRSGNCVGLIQATGCDQIHGSFRSGGETTSSQVVGEVRLAIARLQAHFGNLA